MHQAHVQLDRLRVFVAVAEAGGFTAAAKRLGTSKKLVSHQVHRLEVELGGTLFLRTTRRVVLTEAGRELMRSCRTALDLVALAIDRFGADAEEVTGTLRIATTPELGVGILGSLVAEFGGLHPALRIELLTSIELVDLVAERIDLAVRVGWLRDSSLRSTKFGTFQQYIVGTKDYFDRTGIPEQPEDLAMHRWIELSMLSSPTRWSLTGRNGEVREVRVGSALLGNSPPAVHGLVRGGAGLTALPDFIVQQDLASGRLMRVLADWKLPQGGYYFVHPGNLRPPLRVRAFVEFLRSQPAIISLRRRSPDSELDEARILSARGQR